MPRKNRVGAIDCETDPFLFDRIPEPFSWGLVMDDGSRYLTWGKRCTRKIVDILLELPPCKVYAHNGGKFDFHFLLPYINIDQDIKIINGRFATIKIGDVELIDSFLLMPFALAKFRKTEIDYKLFEADVRNKHKKTIQAYQLDDCFDLLDLITGFKKIVGNKLTIGGAAFHQLKKLGYPIPELSEGHDTNFRRFYYGGRTEVFEGGDFNGNFDFYDINSAYPYAMMFPHPIGPMYTMIKRLPALSKLGPQFFIVDAYSNGALPYRDKDKLTFPRDELLRTYYVTGWEIKAGIETNTIIIDKIHTIFKPAITTDFKLYVDKFHELKQEADAKDDKIGRLAYKYLLNSGYGKYATDPRKFKNYRFSVLGDFIPDMTLEGDYGDLTLWSESTYNGEGFFDVAVSASITGFVRAYLWRAICASKRPLYCDTDSLLCAKFGGKKGANLGDWEKEATITRAYIAGKKLYGFYSKEAFKNNEEKGWKIASKGARLSLSEIRQVCKGKTILWKNDAPSFHIKKAPDFIKRKIKST